MKINNMNVYGVIYKITNKVNNKIYIGQTTKKKGFDDRYCCCGKDTERVYNYYKNRMANGENYNYHLLKSMDKYGLESFEVNKIFDIAYSKEELDIKEKCWISYYKSWNSEFGYNIEMGGELKNRVGRRIVCVNNNLRFISYNQVINYFKNLGVDITKEYIKSTFKTKYKDNRNKLIFRYDSDKLKGKIFCNICGRPVKKLYENQELCPKCNKSVENV